MPGPEPKKKRPVREDSDSDDDLDYGGFRFWPNGPSAPVAGTIADNGNSLYLAPVAPIAPINPYQALNQNTNQVFKPMRVRHPAGSHNVGAQALVQYNNGNGTGDVERNTNAKKKNKPNRKNRNKGLRLDMTGAPDDIHPGLAKYWRNRYRLFTKFDQGIKLDQESWYSVTPEKIAVHMAQKCVTDGVIVDGFCGCGGNTIQFAKYCSKVIAIDIDPVKIEYAKHNAAIYGVADKIEFICGDFMALATSLKADVVFLSPPWGGPTYSMYKEFELSYMTPDGSEIFDKAASITPNIAYYLPKNIKTAQLDTLASGRGIPALEVEANYFQGKIKSKTLYFGNLCGRSVDKPSSETNDADESDESDETDDDA